MTQEAPAFWVRYRGEVDPQNPLTTTYNYATTMYTNNNIIYLIGNYSALGPAQLSKKNYIEIRWSIPPGMNRVAISRGSTVYYTGSGAEGGFRDEGQFLNNRGDVNQQ